MGVAEWTHITASFGEQRNELKRASPKENSWCEVTSEKVYGPFFFEEETVCAVNYLYMIEQQDGLLDTIIYQQDGTPPHWAIIVRGQLNHIFNDRWCSHDGPIPWPPNSPDLTSPIFFLYGATSSRQCTQKDHRIWLPYGGRLQWHFSKSLQKCCMPHGAIWNQGLICATCAVVDMLSANVLWHKRQTLLHMFVPLTSNKFA